MAAVRADGTMEEHGLHRKVAAGDDRVVVSSSYSGECNKQHSTVPDRASGRRRLTSRAGRAVSLGEDGLSTLATGHVDCRL